MSRFTVGRLAVLVALLALSPPAGAQSRGDDWFGVDKAKHFGVTAGLAAGSYALGTAFMGARGHALVLGAGVSLGAGVAKEIFDVSGLGDPSWKDLAWDAFGAVFGLAAAWSIDLLLRGVSAKHPLFTVPHVESEGFGLRMFAPL